MSLRRFIIDTNVLVAGLITHAPNSPTVRVLDAMLEGSLHCVVSPALLDEYRAVLLRPKLQRMHGLTMSELDTFLAEIVANAQWLEPTPNSTHTAPDPGDQHLWLLLDQDPSFCLVTGDKLLLDQPRPGSLVISPGDCLQWLSH